MNYLVGQDLEHGAYRVTFRLINMIDNPTNWDYIEPKIREVPYFDPNLLHAIGEEKDDFRGEWSDDLYEYDTFGGYNNAGGYVVYLSGDKSEYF